MEERQITFNFKARYYKLGNITPETRQLWYVLHGYGQLAQHFLKKFEGLPLDQVCVLAPEGLSRFYLTDVETRAQTGNDRVGATWMTKENRAMDIENYLTYLTRIHRLECADLIIPVTILGFSQGAATATRWALSGQVEFRRLILWAGIFPPDMDFEKGHQILKTKETVAVFGTQDPFITPERLVEMKSLSERLQIFPRVLRFEGKHELDPTILQSLV